ncbi:hypothetical protein NFC73_07605 [Pseudarthrobacter sp. RMG13]|uniref:Uncharacterized protein n=1 Tax=Pseudarthrobacter humi TaxID=2952523 RepID=A0ABT1LP48_9MICC|nr:hypothetical protein [Pseudarthrobacter humi]MCP8999596.1 hypothetical protein [Pseudarthrobacter humi]
MSKHWCRVRTKLKLERLTSHTFRKSVGADQPGHAQLSVTTDVHVGRKWLHTEVADVLDNKVG